MKLFLAAISSVFLISADQTCNKKASKCYRGRLEIKGICMNYTIKVLEGNIDPSLIMPQWTDEQTGRSHQNVFGLQSRCTFPENIKEGDEFYFTIGASAQDCVLCQAYYPTPPKTLSITVVSDPCK